MLIKIRYWKSLTAGVIFAGIAMSTHGQGCSDPGICTTGTLNSASTQDSISFINFADADLAQLMNAHVASERFNVGLEFALQNGEKGTSIYSAVLRGGMRIKDKTMIGFKLPISYVNGDLGSLTAPGDLTISVRSVLTSGRGRTLAFTGGVVIPTNKADAKADGFDLPMAYQTSLGSFNALVGFNYKTKFFSAMVGYQHSFGTNSNGFTHEALELDTSMMAYDPLNPTRLSYASSRKLMRGGDLVLRLEGGYSFGKFAVFGGILPIYRVAKSSYERLDGTRMDIDGTDGLTLNLTAGMRYSFSNSFSLTANYGSPVIQREVRADGLTRTSVIIVGVVYKIW